MYIVLLLGVLVVITWALVLGSRSVSASKAAVRVVIPKGSSASEIAAILDERRLIRSPFVFRLTCRMSGASARLKPGVYDLNQSMSAPQIIERLVDGQTLEQWITVPEGYTARQIADLLEETKLANSEAFLGLAIFQGYEFPQYTFVYGSSLEGYLFPDTYLVARGTDAQAIIEKMLYTFDKKVIQDHRSEIESTIQRRFGLGRDAFAEGLNRILVLASLVEREARVPRDRPLIAAVLWNRLAKNMRLEIDATVSYKPGQSRGNKDRVFYSDLSSDSPYNTYKRAGLPPTPICNPGLAAIEAVLEPASVGYLYYVARPDGSHIFSTTFEQHSKARNAVRNGRG